jgi:hypothetical protein
MSDMLDCSAILNEIPWQLAVIGGEHAPQKLLLLLLLQLLLLQLQPIILSSLDS